MALNISELQMVLREISPALRGGWIQKIQQPMDRTLVLDVRVPGQTHRLLISCRPDSARLHVTTHSPANPPTPPPFCQFLRAHFQGARIDDIRQIGNDRIVELQLIGGEGTHAIVCDLTGNKANILVLNAERLVLRDLTRQYRLAGQTYAPPSQRNTNHETVPSCFAGKVGGMFPVSEAIDAHYREQETTHTIDRIKADRLRTLKKTLKKEQRLIEAWRHDLSRATAYRDYARYGELIKANLSAIMKGTDHIEMTDYFDDRLPTITIPLDPMKSPQGNMDDYFESIENFLPPNVNSSHVSSEASTA